MAYPLLVSTPSSEYFDGAIKYVEYTGQSAVKAEYIPSGNPLIQKAGGSELLKKLMVVKFNGPSSDEIKDTLLTEGIECDGSRYHFLIYSGEQLEKGTCYVGCETMQEIANTLHLQMPSTSEYYQANIAESLFSNCLFSLELEEEAFCFPKYKSFEDTGICGFMSTELAMDIQNHHRLAHAPNMVRVVHQNFSGLLIRSDKAVKAPHKVAVANVTMWRQSLSDLRQSKMKEPLRNVLGIRDIHQPKDTICYLDAQTIAHLLEKGVSYSHLEELQQRYNKILDTAEDDRTHALFFLKITGNEVLRKEIEEKGLTEEKRFQLRQVKESEIRQMKNMPSSLRVLVPRARQVFVIPDSSSALGTDKCCFTPSLADGSSEKEAFKSVTKVLIIPCPCFSPDDACVMTLDKVSSTNIRDCLVLPRNSSCFRPNQKYLVIWDPKLFPNPQPRRSIKDRLVQWSMSQIPISGGRRKAFPSSQKISKGAREEIPLGREAMVEHFVNRIYNDKLIARAKEAYLKFALTKGPSCKECGQLENALLGRVDLMKSRKELEKRIARLEESCASPTTSGDACDEEEEGAVANPTVKEPVRLLRRLEDKAREYVERGRMNIR